MISNIFISYRRNDTAGYAIALYNKLCEHFKKDQIFMDIDTIEPGVDFVEAIENAVSSCSVLIALIGQNWLNATDLSGRKLDNPKDLVRIEISTALKRNIRVIPVLIDGITMPQPDELPGSLQSLSRRNALEISNTRFNSDVERLIDVLKKEDSEQAFSIKGKTISPQREKSTPIVDRDEFKNKGYYETGELQYEYRYVNGEREGITKEYYKNGKLKVEWLYQNDQLANVSKEYYENGKLKAEWMYQNGQLANGSKKYYETGELQYEYRYVNGKREGITKEYYKNGKLKVEWLYQNGQLANVSKEYYENGKLKAEWMYQSDQLID